MGASSSTPQARSTSARRGQRLGYHDGYFATGDNNPMKTLIWRLGYTFRPFWAGFSGTYGVEKAGDSDPRLSLDLTGAATVGTMLTINFQGNYGSEKKAQCSNRPRRPTGLASAFSQW